MRPHLGGQLKMAQYEIAIQLQSKIESREIQNTSELLKECSRLEASYKTFNLVESWAIARKYFN